MMLGDYAVFAVQLGVELGLERVDTALVESTEQRSYAEAALE